MGTAEALRKHERVAQQASRIECLSLWGDAYPVGPHCGDIYGPLVEEKIRKPGEKNCHGAKWDGRTNALIRSVLLATNH